MMRAQLSVVVIAAVACGPKATSTESTPANTVVEETPANPNLPVGVTDGALWTCQIDFYDPQPCKLTEDAGTWTLTKLLGSQRFRGSASFTPEGIAFDGAYFCPWGDCTTPLVTTFVDQGGHQYAASHDGTPILLVWDEGYADEWGGAGYGNLTGDEAAY